MSLSDPIADMLTRMRNAGRAKARTVKVMKSKICVSIAQVLKDEGYITDYDVIDDGAQGLIRITLKYGPNGDGLLQSVRRESKPGRRVYRAVTELPRVLDGLGIAIVSTSKGVMSDRRCRLEKVGGELLCTVY